jgi:hypothetical protein
MFEIKVSGKPNDQLRALFPTMGYRLFRQLEDSPILVPDDPTQPVDEYELNLFAAKPDRVSDLAQRGLLVEAIPEWAPDESDCKKADAFWQSQQFAPLVGMSGGKNVSPDSDYRNSLAAYATWRAADQPAATRCAALAFALRGVRSGCTRAVTAGRLSTLARIAWEWGARAESVAALRRLLDMLQGGQIQFGEPFWPASLRFESIALGDRPGDWFAGAAAEQFERSSHYSSSFIGPSSFLEWLCGLPFVPAEMERRSVLLRARAGLRPIVPVRLRTRAADHLNASVWRAGQVPGTFVEPS